nr:OB-fold domain-containing protein [Pseudomonadota bacterium]
GLHKEFYDHCKNHALHFQRCSDCQIWRHVPREMCPECGSWNWSWEASSGRGRVFTWTVVARPMHPAFVDACPYAPVVIEMEEGVRLLSEVADVAPADLEIDMEVTVHYDDVTDEVTLPKFKKL